jgi:hypothetical protein
MEKLAFIVPLSRPGAVKLCGTLLFDMLRLDHWPSVTPLTVTAETLAGSDNITVCGIVNV